MEATVRRGLIKQSSRRDDYMTDRNISSEIRLKKLEAALLEIAQIVKTIEALQNTTAHLESIQTSTETAETRSFMLGYQDLFIDQIAKKVSEVFTGCT